MASTIKIRAKSRDGICDLRALIKHPMETGQRKDPKTGALIPAHFINEVTVTHNGAKMITGNWGGAISKNPYFSVELAGVQAGDTLQVTWRDILGNEDSETETVR